MVACCSVQLVQVPRGMGRHLETSHPCPSDSAPVQGSAVLLSASQLCVHFKAASLLQALTAP